MDGHYIAGEHGSPRLNHGLGQANTGRAISRYHQQEEIIFSSGSSSSEDEETAKRGAKAVIAKRPGNMSKSMNFRDSKVPFTDTAAPSQGRTKVGPFSLPLPENGLLKRTVDGRMKHSSKLFSERSSGVVKSPNSLLWRLGSGQGDAKLSEEEDSNGLELLQKFIGKEERMVKDKNQALPSDSEDEVPFALQESQLGAKPVTHIYSSVTTKTQPKRILPDPTSTLHHKHSRSTISTAPSFKDSEESDPPLVASRPQKRSQSSYRQFQARHDFNEDSASDFLPKSKPVHSPSRRPPPVQLLDNRSSLRSRSTEPFAFALGTQSPSAQNPPSVARKSTGGKLHKPISSSLHKREKLHLSRSRNHPLHHNIQETPTSHLLRSPISTLLHRQLGNRLHGKMAGAYIQDSTYAALRKTHQWIDGRASGDILVVDWSPKGMHYVAGASNTMDPANPHYNNRYNLLAGDMNTNTLYDLSDHYLGSPSTSSSGIDNLAPLYTTITNVKWDMSGDLMYSSSYDWTVKKWEMSDPGLGGILECVDTYYHENPVIVMDVSSVEDTGYLATATNHEQQPTESPVTLFNVYADAGDWKETKLTCTQGFKKYLPTALQWGATQETKGLLAAGFSAKPQESRQEPVAQGLLCLWEISNERGISQKSIAPSTSNVFDLAWHPVKPWLASASPIAPNLAANYGRGTRSLIRVYEPLKGPSKIAEYECPGLDVNTVSFCGTDENVMSASCTDGVTYVWDYRKSSLILHQLTHGDPLEPKARREVENTGVRVALWGPRDEFFYTGSDDGVLKQWDVKRAPEDALVRDVEAFPADVMSAKFSPDFSYLLVGDAAGGIHVLSADPYLDAEGHVQARSIIFEPSSEMDDHLDDYLEDTEIVIDVPSQPGVEAAQELVRTGQIAMDPVYGPGQGPNYSGPYAHYAHIDGDPSNLLLPEMQALQLDDRQSHGYEASLDEASARRRAADQELARARNGGLSAAGTTSDGDESTGNAGNVGRKMSTVSVEMEDAGEDNVVIKDEDVTMGRSSASPAPSGWIPVPASPTGRSTGRSSGRATEPEIIDLTND